MYRKDVRTCLHYPYPFGTTFHDDETVQPGDFPTDIRNRGVVSCGIVLEARFAAYNEISGTFSGIDVEFCRALAAGLLMGNTRKAEFFVLDPYSAFQALQDGVIDVLAGTEDTLTNEFAEPTTGQSF